MNISKPCPVYFSESSRVDGGFSCKSCSTIVVDFTDKTPEEISMLLKENMCGIFRNDQLSEAPRFSFRNRVLFSILAFASFIGFNVHPVQAQETKKRIETTQEPVCPNDGRTSYPKDATEKEAKIKNQIRNPKKYRKTKTYKIIGCPSF